MTEQLFEIVTDEDGAETKLMHISRELIHQMARVAHQDAYDRRGERYADPNEMRMHMDDPCACWDMVQAKLEFMLGADFLTCDTYTFTFEVRPLPEYPSFTESAAEAS